MRPKRIINIYRSFNPQNVTAKELFDKQLDLIGAAFNDDAMLLGDLNLDYSRKHDISYSNAPLFDLFDLKLGALNLVQLVDFSTWSRVVGLSVRSSCLDHVYVKDRAIINNVNHLKHCFGDHELITVELCIARPNPTVSMRRDWRLYSKEKLELELSSVDWSNDATVVQEVWNDFENKLIRVIDYFAPMSEFIGNNIQTKISPSIK